MTRDVGISLIYRLLVCSFVTVAVGVATTFINKSQDELILRDLKMLLLVSVVAQHVVCSACVAIVA